MQCIILWTTTFVFPCHKRKGSFYTLSKAAAACAMLQEWVIGFGLVP